MRLTKYQKQFIKHSVYDLGIFELRNIAEENGAKTANRIMKIIRHLQRKQKLVLITMYANCTRANINYYKWSNEQLSKMGYIFKDGFFIKYDLTTIH